MRKARALAGVTAGLMLLSASAALAQSGDNTVTVIHGVPGLTVDVYVNGDLTLEDFAPETITDPLALPAGTYEIEIYAADADPEADEPAIAGSATLPGGANATLIAHLGADGTPTLTPFVNDVTATDAGDGRLTVRHTAAAPAVDVRAGGAVVFSNLTNPNEAKADLAAGTVSADVVLAGTDTVALGPADVTISEGVSTIVYAIGSAEDGNLGLLVQTISGLHSAPAGVPSGTGGLVDDALPLWAVALMLVGLAGLAAPAVAAVRRRS
jgi:hypothetical protein